MAVLNPRCSAKGLVGVRVDEGGVDGEFCGDGELLE